MKAIQRKHAVPAVLCAALLTLTVSGCAQESAATTDETLANTAEVVQEEVVATEDGATSEEANSDEAEATLETDTTEAAEENETADEVTTDEAETVDDKADDSDEAATKDAAPAAVTGSYSSNDTAVKGEYTPYDPATEAEITGGTGIEGSEEEQLQQERIAGGAVGAVVSKNLEPLVGITDYSEGEYVPVYGISIDPPAVVHGDANGDACSTCHMGDTPVATSVPNSHLNQNLTDEDCVTCHRL